MRELKIFVITPVRNILPAWRQALDDYVRSLQQQNCQVYYPPWDTSQDDNTGLGICRCNREALIWADEVHIAWDGESEGCLFDLGMAFAFGKPVVPIVGFFPTMTQHKSFATMVHDWAEKGRP